MTENRLSKEKPNLVEGKETAGATGVRRVPAIPLQPLDRSGWNGGSVAAEIERRWAPKRADAVEADAAEAEHGIAGGVGPRQPYVALLQSALQRLHALLVVLRHHRRRVVLLLRRRRELQR